jgi:hypothetical protein
VCLIKQNIDASDADELIPPYAIPHIFLLQAEAVESPGDSTVRPVYADNSVVTDGSSGFVDGNNNSKNDGDEGGESVIAGSRALGKAQVLSGNWR